MLALSSTVRNDQQPSRVRALTHTELCNRACRWLAGTRRCDPVFSRIASCAEVPDAIGWSSRFQWSGSTVVECKTSAGDFHSDRRKYLAFQDPQYYWMYSGRRSRITKKEATERGYEIIHLPRMGNFRFFMCAPGVLSDSMIEKYAPDHGLLYVPDGRRVVVVRPAPRRGLVDRDGEIRYLRFAIINQKDPHNPQLQRANAEEPQPAKDSPAEPQPQK